MTKRRKSNTLKATHVCKECGAPASIAELKGEWIIYEKTCRKCGGETVLTFR
jgi:ribosomal protein L40E